MATLVDICNMALAEIATGPITDLSDNAIEAREAGRFALPLLAEIALWSDWSWAVTRALLTEITNDRPAEWLHAYAVPDTCVRPLAIRRDEPDATILPLAGAFPFPLQDALPLAFLHEGGLIYSNVDSASLVFIATQADPTVLPPLVQRAFVLELAARLAVPVRKDVGLARQLAGAAELARDRAIAEDRNQRAASGPSFISEAALARAGWGDAA